MTQNVQKQQESPQPIKHTEHILVVERKKFFGLEPAWSGLKQVDVARYTHLIQENKQFLPRDLMEQDPTYKQIIPYLIFTHNQKLFLMQRAETAGEQRLKNKYTLGIGGHVRSEDLQTGSLIDWAQREFDEEIAYTGDLTIEPLGILNDDSNAVGQVHVGFVFLLRGSTDQIAIRSEFKSGQLISLTEGSHYFPMMESWSQFVFEFLLERKKI